MLGATGYKTKKALKSTVGQPLNYIETSMFGEEYKENGSVTIVGPCAQTKRTWFAKVTLKNGLITKVE
jgi:hypothetical protein